MKKQASVVAAPVRKRRKQGVGKPKGSEWPLSWWHMVRGRKFFSYRRSSLNVVVKP